MMTRLGHRPFGMNPSWLAGCYARRFPRAIVDILMCDIGLSDMQVYHQLHDYFDYRPLHIFEPTSVEIAWSTSNGPAGDSYLHEAHIPYQGVKEFWRLRSSVSADFRTRLRLGESETHMRLLLPDRDVEQFREVVIADLESAAYLVAHQQGAIDNTKFWVHERIEHLFRTGDIWPYRDEAQARLDAKARIKRHEALMPDTI